MYAKPTVKHIGQYAKFGFIRSAIVCKVSASDDANPLASIMTTLRSLERRQQTRRLHRKLPGNLASNFEADKTMAS